MTVGEASAFFAGLELEPFARQVAEKLVQEVRGRLKFLLEVGLDYISLDRMTFTLSGGEAQRINLAAALSSSLVGTLFVLDEPSIGLHPRDNGRLIQILKSLKDIGNTVVVVEHDPDIVRAAEHVIDLGPRAGEPGGEVVFAGPWPGFLRSSGSLTSPYIRGEKEIALPKARRRARPFLLIRDAHKHNLKHIDVRLPLGVFHLRDGRLRLGQEHAPQRRPLPGLERDIRERLREIRGRDKVAKVIMVDQSPLSTSPRSIPATYTKAMDGIRDLFSQTREAKALGFKPGYFSFNTTGGRCEECGGRTADRRDAVPLGRQPRLRRLQGQALQKGDPRRPLERQEYLTTSCT